MLQNYCLFLSPKNYVWSLLRQRHGQLQPNLQRHFRQKLKFNPNRRRGRTNKSVAQKQWDPHHQSQRYTPSYQGHTDYLNKIDTSLCNKYLLSSGGDGLRFFNLSILKPLGGWRDSSIIEIASFTHNHKVIFLFGDNSHLYALT